MGVSTAAIGVGAVEAGAGASLVCSSVANLGGNVDKLKKAQQDTECVSKGDEKNRSIDITNDVLESARVGSALKEDQYHAFNDIIDNYADQAVKTNIGNADLFQLEGSLNGTAGRFEWIIQNGQVTHRMFVPGGIVNGVPIKP